MESLFFGLAGRPTTTYCLTAEAEAEAEAEASFGFEGLWGHWGQRSRGSISSLSGASWYRAKTSG